MEAPQQFRPVKSEERICFGIEWFATEQEAEEFGKFVRERGDTYNGGFFDGVRCGRDKSFDRDGLFAVTVG